ncbi:hypothetical protein [Sphingopyxis sp. 22461]|uniref:hypothetical protein n=1 Tax=Sphingopyxis sp. 22461 TaxID=3453923 RepID=UPI003F83F7B1
MKDAHQMRILSRGAVGVGLCEPEHVALTLPVDRKVIDARQELSIEVRGLAAVEDCGRDIGRKVSEPEQGAEVWRRYCHRGRRGFD